MPLRRKIEWKLLRSTSLMAALSTASTMLLFTTLRPTDAREVCLLFCPVQLDCKLEFNTNGTCTCTCKTLIPDDKEMSGDAGVLKDRRAVETIGLGTTADGKNLTYVPARAGDKNSDKSARDRLKELLND